MQTMFYVQFADNHDIHSIKVYELESAKEDKDTDYSKLTPSAALFAPPRGESCSVGSIMDFSLSSDPTFPSLPNFLSYPPPPKKKQGS